MHRLTAVLLLGLAAAGCAGSDDVDDGGEAAVTLGPVDGHDLPPTDTARVQAGDLAPDFTLASLSGEPVTLSGYRGEKNVVLVFYRGHW